MTLSMPSAIDCHIGFGVVEPPEEASAPGSLSGRVCLHWLDELKSPDCGDVNVHVRGRAYIHHMQRATSQLHVLLLWATHASNTVLAAFKFPGLSAEDMRRMSCELPGKIHKNKQKLHAYPLCSSTVCFHCCMLLECYAQPVQGTARGRLLPPGQGNNCCGAQCPQGLLELPQMRGKGVFGDVVRLLSQRWFGLATIRESFRKAYPEAVGS